MTVSTARASSSCETPAFYIEGVEVSARANDAETARQQAMEEALQKAWAKLTGRVLVEHPVPETAHAVDNVSAAASVGPLVDYVRIDSETVLPKRYIATLTYCFDRNRTRTYLDEQGLGHAELMSGPMLVLPIWNMGDKPHLWRRPNPWGKAWSTLMRDRDGLVDLVEVGSLATERALSAEDVMAFNVQSLARAAQLEGAEKVIVTVVTPRLEEGQIKAGVEAILFNRNGLRESEFFRRDDISFPVSNTNAAMLALADEIETGLETVWRDVNRVSLLKRGGFTLRIDARSVREWSAQLDMLAGLSPVEEMRVIQLDSGGGLVRLLLSSSMQSLTYALEAEGLTLVPREDQYGQQEFVLKQRGN